jgi:hypothetical protein
MPQPLRGFKALRASGREGVNCKRSTYSTMKPYDQKPVSAPGSYRLMGLQFSPFLNFLQLGEKSESSPNNLATARPNQSWVCKIPSDVPDRLPDCTRQ